MVGIRAPDAHGAAGVGPAAFAWPVARPADKWSIPVPIGQPVGAVLDELAGRPVDGWSTECSRQYLSWRYGFEPLHYRVIEVRAGTRSFGSSIAEHSTRWRWSSGCPSRGPGRRRCIGPSRWGLRRGHRSTHSPRICSIGPPGPIVTWRRSPLLQSRRCPRSSSRSATSSCSDHERQFRCIAGRAGRSGVAVQPARRGDPGRARAMACTRGDRGRGVVGPRRGPVDCGRDLRAASLLVHRCATRCG